jgi:hypothetical protein
MHAISKRLRSPRRNLAPCQLHANATASYALMMRIRPIISRNVWRWNASVRQSSQARSAATSTGGKRGRPKGQQHYWSDEKLSTVPKYPLSAAMAETIHPNMEIKTPRRKKTRNESATVLPGNIHVRTQIVSPDLCGTSSPGTLMSRERVTDTLYLQMTCSNTSATH